MKILSEFLRILLSSIQIFVNKIESQMIATSKIITNQNQNLFYIKIGNEKICSLN